MKNIIDKFKLVPSLILIILLIFVIITLFCCSLYIENKLMDIMCWLSMIATCCLYFNYNTFLKYFYKNLDK